MKNAADLDGDINAMNINAFIKKNQQKSYLPLKKIDLKRKTLKKIY